MAVLLEELKNRELESQFILDVLDDNKIRSDQADRTKGISQIKRFTLSSAQILALNSTPVTIIPTFSQSIIIVEAITARLNFNTTAYTGSNNLEFRYTDASGTKVTADLTSAFLNSGSTAYASVLGVEAQFTPVINTPIVVRVPTTNPATGNSTLNLLIKYRLVRF